MSFFQLRIPNLREASDSKVREYSHSRRCLKTDFDVLSYARPLNSEKIIANEMPALGLNQRRIPFESQSCKNSLCLFGCLSGKLDNRFRRYRTRIHRFVPLPGGRPYGERDYSLSELRSRICRQGFLDREKSRLPQMQISLQSGIAGRRRFAQVEKERQEKER